MIKIRVFRFEVSNWSSAARGSDVGTGSYMEAQGRLWSTEQIENALNRFSREHDVISVAVNTIDVQYHNNSRGNTVDLVYTITYKED